MKNLFSTLLSTVKASFIKIWTRLRMFFSITFWRTKGIAKLREFFTKLLDVKPRHKKDYYPLLGWLVSKKLAFAIVVVLGVLGAFYIWTMLPAAASAGEGAVRTYKYTALPLKFIDGKVRILARDKTVAYIGNVKKGCASGNGQLFDREGGLVYEGAFEDSQYNGNGTLYFEDGTVRYTGSFANNLFNGVGSCFRQSGTLEYEGEYAAGQRSGHGKLYDAGGNPVYEGTFQTDNIVYSELLGKKTSEVAAMYTGRESVYSTNNETCTELADIGAVYTAANGADSLDGEWSVGNVCVLADSFPFNGRRLTSVNEITSQLGVPSYFGVTRVTLTEAVAMNLLAEDDKMIFGEVALTAEETFTGVWDVEDYDMDFEVYIYTYEHEGVLYTFYCAAAGQPGFAMYAMEQIAE